MSKKHYQRGRPRSRKNHPVTVRKATQEELSRKRPDPKNEGAGWEGVTGAEARATLTYWLNQQKRRHGTEQ